MENGKWLVAGISAGITAVVTYKLIKHYKKLCSKCVNDEDSVVSS